MWDFLEYFTYKNVFIVFFSLYSFLWLMEIYYKKEIKKRIFVAGKTNHPNKSQFVGNKEIDMKHK